MGMIPSYIRHKETLSTPYVERIIQAIRYGLINKSLMMTSPEISVANPREHEELYMKQFVEVHYFGMPMIFFHPSNLMCLALKFVNSRWNSLQFVKFHYN